VVLNDLNSVAGSFKIYKLFVFVLLHDMGQTIVAYTKFLTECLQMLSLNWWQSTRRPGNITNFKRDFGPEHWWLFFSDVLFGNLVEKMRVFFSSQFGKLYHQNG
jgi:hypothetical protein